MTRAHMKATTLAAKAPRAADAKEREQAARLDDLASFRVVVQTCPDPIIICDAHGHVTYANAAFEETFLTTSADVVGKPPAFVPDAYRLQYVEILEKLHAGVSVASVETKRLNTFDMEFDVLFSAAPLTAPDGAYAGHVEFIKDVTELHLIEQTLKSSNDRYLALMRTSPDAIVVYDAAGGLSLSNEAFDRLFGYDVPELRGGELDFIPKSAQAAADAALDIVLAGGIAQYESQRLTASGKRIDVSISTSPFVDENGQVVGRTEILRDISARKQAERELHSSKRQLERMNAQLVIANTRMMELDRVKTEFLSNVSHELRTPLTAIRGFAEMIDIKLRDTIFPRVASPDTRTANAMAKVGRNLSIILSESERLTALINNVLDIAKMEAGKTEWKSEPVVIADVVDRAGAVMAPLAERKGLGLVIESGDPALRLTGDRDRLVQVVINLLSNAFKFTHRGEVVCRVERVDDTVRISVRDQGIGIAPRDMSSIFDQFKQVGDTLVDKPQGTGLGLPICKQIVEHHGGTIHVESEPGKGSLFTVILPLSHPAA